MGNFFFELTGWMTEMCTVWVAIEYWKAAKSVLGERLSLQSDKSVCFWILRIYYSTVPAATGMSKGLATDSLFLWNWTHFGCYGGSWEDLNILLLKSPQS